MAGPRLTALRKQFTDVKAGIDKIEQAATAAGRDLTDDEQIDVDKLYDRAKQLQPEIDELAGREESLQATAAVLQRLGLDPVGAAQHDRARGDKAPEMTAGEYIVEYVKAAQSGDWDSFHDRAARYFDRADQKWADNSAIVPKAIIGPLINLYDASRPVFSSFTQRPMPPHGKTFARPRVTQHVTVGEQAAEMDALASQKMTLASEDVTKRTFGGQLTISRQDIDWTDPSILQIVVDDFASVYSQLVEGEACDHLEALITTNTSDYVDTTIATLVESYVEACLAVYASSKRMPDTVWHDLASWAALCQKINTNNDRTALSMIKEALEPLGVNLTWKVGPQLAADTRIIGVRSLVEAYEQQHGLLSVENPGTLSRTVAYSGYVAFWGRAEGFVGLVEPE